MLLLVGLSFAAAPAWSLLPFGVGVYAHHRPVRGLVYSLTQVAGFSALAYGSVQADRARDAEDEPTYYRWETVSALGATAGLGSWIGAAVDAGRLHDLEARAQADALRRWDQQLLLARGSAHD